MVKEGERSFLTSEQILVDIYVVLMFDGRGMVVVMIIFHFAKILFTSTKEISAFCFRVVTT